jgi:hypothetical protein
MPLPDSGLTRPLDLRVPVVPEVIEIRTFNVAELFEWAT